MLVDPLRSEQSTSNQSKSATFLQFSVKQAQNVRLVSAVMTIFPAARFVELKDLGVRADLVTYNTLLKACMRSANLPCAEVIMSQLRQHGLKVYSRVSIQRRCRYADLSLFCSSLI